MMRRTGSSGSSDGERIYRPSGIAMQNKSGHGGSGYSSSTMSSSYTPSPRQQRQDMYPEERSSCDNGYERRSIECIERLLDVAIDSQNMLREYLELGHGNNQSQRTQNHSVDADEDGGAATTAATQAAVNALMPDIFRSGSNKAALNFEITSDKASHYLQKFARIVSDTWLSDYKTGHVTDPEDSNIYSRKVATLAMMVSTSLSKIGYPSEHVSAGKVAALIKKLVKQCRWRAKQDRIVKTEEGGESESPREDAVTLSHVPPRNRGTETSAARARVEVVVGSDSGDEDYDEEDEELSDLNDSEVSSQRSDLPHQHQRSVAAPPARSHKTPASRKEDAKVSSSQRSAAPAAKRQKPTTPADDGDDAKRKKTAAPVVDMSKEKPSAAVGRKKKCNWPLSWSSESPFIHVSATRIMPTSHHN
jgi:hypothetical protein